MIRDGCQLVKAVCGVVGLIFVSLLYLSFLSSRPEDLIVSSRRHPLVSIAVRSSAATQAARLPVILQSWLRDVTLRQKVWVVVDDVQSVQSLTSSPKLPSVRFMESRCMTKQKQLDQCCKLSISFNKYYQDPTPWFCHFDDDNFVSIENLEALLVQYQSNKNFYLGRNSISTPLEAAVPGSGEELMSFFFGTLGAGVCMSRSLMLTLTHALSGNMFVNWCQDLGRADDETLGFLVALFSDAQLTVVNKLHSHLENLSQLDPHSLTHQISLSYALRANNTIQLPWEPFYAKKKDPTRFLSLYRHIHANDLNITQF